MSKPIEIIQAMRIPPVTVEEARAILRAHAAQVKRERIPTPGQCPYCGFDAIFFDREPSPRWSLKDEDGTYIDYCPKCGLPLEVEP